MFYGMIEFLKETLDISTIMFFCFTGSLYYAFLYASIRAIMDVVFIRMPSPHAKLQAEASVQLDLYLSKGFYYSCTLRKMVCNYFTKKWGEKLQNFDKKKTKQALFSNLVNYPKRDC